MTEPKDTFGKDAASLAMLLHLVSLLEGMKDGPFKSGFQMAIEEAGAFLSPLPFKHSLQS